MKGLKQKCFLGFALLSLTFATFFYSLPLKGHIPVLMYHFIVPKDQAGATSLLLSVNDFHSQMWFLKTFGFRTISLDEFYAIKTGQTRARGRELVITFDDGDRSFIEQALPILERYKIQSVNFVIWNYVSQKKFKSMNLEDVERLSRHPLVTIGSHTLTHAALSEVSPEQARFEIVKSKEELENALNKKIYYFCYPIGSFNNEVMRFVEKVGYRLAFTTARKHLNGYPETLYSIVRIKVHPKHNLFIFWLNVSGIIYYANRIDDFFHQLTGHKVNDKLNVYEPAYKAT